MPFSLVHLHSRVVLTYRHFDRVGYVVDRCLICPGVAMMADYAAQKTIHNMEDVSQFFVASEWNLRNLSLSVGDGGPVTLIAPSNTAWNFLGLQEKTRLATDKWKRHLWDLLKHLLIQGKYAKEDLKRIVEENGGPVNVTMLSGEHVVVTYDLALNLVMVDGGKLFLSDISGVDG